MAVIFFGIPKKGRAEEVRRKRQEVGTTTIWILHTSYFLLRYF
jgi:hypothetical protein